MRFIALSTLLLATSLVGGQESIDEGPAQAIEQAVDDSGAAPPIIIDADNSNSDLRSGITRMTGNIAIQRGAMLVNADEGLVHQIDGRIALIELFGDPTTWRDRLDDGSIVEGRANKIEYQLDENVVTLTGDARLQHEGGRFTGDKLIYDLDTESLAGSSTDGNQVRVVIEGDTMRRRTSGEDEPPPETDSEGESSAEEKDPVDPPADS